MNRRRFIATTTLAGSATLAAGWLPGRPGGPGRYYDNILRLVEYVVDNFHKTPVNLVSALPSGTVYSGKQRGDLKHLYWLQNNNLFAHYALRPYAPEASRSIEKEYRHRYETEFGNIVEKTEHYYPVGRAPAHTPPQGRFFRMRVERREHEGYTIETYDPQRTAEIRDGESRGVLKFGATGEAARGNLERGRDYLKRAIALSDGNGFMHTRWDRHGSYYARYRAFALITERALETRIPSPVREEIEDRLWSIQDDDGGIWTNYYPDGSYPLFAKKTMESGPLAHSPTTETSGPNNDSVGRAKRTSCLQT